jgi:hypothetical protein
VVVALNTKSQPGKVIRSPKLVHSSDYVWGRTTQYSTEVFHLQKGEYLVDIANKGCEGGEFSGGMAYLNYYHPVIIPTNFLLKLGAYLFSAIALCCFILSLVKVDIGKK